MTSIYKSAEGERAVRERYLQFLKYWPVPSQQLHVPTREGETFDGALFAKWLDDQPDLSPKWRPRYVRVSATLPTTPTNKVLTRTLVHQKFRSDRVNGDPIYVRERGSADFRQFTSQDEAALREKFEANGRGEVWAL